jgi:hypothetical protein
MMIQPPAFSYGSSINVWILKDQANKTREIAVTGHADSATCRRVSGQVMSLFLKKEREPEDLFVAGAAHLVDHGDQGIRELLLRHKSVREFVAAQRELWAADAAVDLLAKNAGEGDTDQSALSEAREARASAQRRADEMRADRLVEAYLRESRSAEAVDGFVSEVTEFSRENGLINVREVPYELIEQARARIAASSSSQAEVISFEDLLKSSGTREAALFTPMLTVPGGRPVELRIPLASLHTAHFNEAQRNNRNEVTQAIVGNAHDRLEVFNKAKERYRQTQATCNKLSAEALRKVVVLDRICTREGVCVMRDKPIRMTQREYCMVTIPLNLELVNEWIGNTKELLKTIEEDAEREGDSRILGFDYNTLVDSMLRDWRLPVPRSQAAFDSWRAIARGRVWNLLNAQLSRLGIAPDAIGGEQLVFSVQVDEGELVVRPIHVIDMARSVLVVDPASGATCVLDAWSMRYEIPVAMAPAYASPEVEGLVRESIRLLTTGDVDGAEARITAAFSRDPAAAFRRVEREWLSQFPDTHEQLLKIQESLKPLVEAIEWQEGLEKLRSDPSSKEDPREEVDAFHAFLESYPKAPVDLHLELALKLTGYLAEIQNDLNKRRQLPAKPLVPLSDWDVLLAYVPRGSGPGLRLFAGQTPSGDGNGAGAGLVPGTPPRARGQKPEAHLGSRGYKGR